MKPDARRRPRRETRSITLQDVAERCGLAKATVGFALRGDPRIKPETAERIRAAAAELGYDPSRQDWARRLSLRKSGREAPTQTVYLFFPHAFYRMAFYTRMLNGLLDVLMPIGYSLTTGYRVDDAQAPFGRRLPPVVRSGGVDGAVLFPQWDDRPTVQALRADPAFGEKPIVCLVVPVPGCVNVRMDEERAAYDSASHLLDRGHRHLLHLYHPFSNGTAPKERIEGVRRALRDCGLDPAKHLHLLENDTDWHDALQATSEYADGLHAPAKARAHPLIRYLLSHREVTGVLAMNDAYALHAYYALRHVGLKVPDDIGLIGFDDVIPIPDARGRNLLTSVRLPLEELGRTGARLLLEAIRSGRAPRDPAPLPAQLMVRASTGPRRA